MRSIGSARYCHTRVRPRLSQRLSTPFASHCVAVAYQFGALYIKFLGTHADYDRIDAATVDQ